MKTATILYTILGGVAGTFIEDSDPTRFMLRTSKYKSKLLIHLLLVFYPKSFKKP